MCIIGKTSSTRDKTNTSDEFSLWLQGQKEVNPTDIVVTQNLDESQSQTYGLVTRIENMSDSESHLDNFVSHDFGDATTDPQTQRLSTNVARCAVLKNTKDIYMPVESGCDVKFADRDGILTALGVGEVRDTNPQFRELPVGIIEQSNDLQAPAIIDARYLLGPEGAHFNISGISGLAAKTSYAMFLLNVLLQKYPEDVAVIIFNVKQDDLLYIDQPAGQELQGDQQKLWTTLDMAPQHFQNVKYFVPRGVIGSARRVIPNIFPSTPLDSSLMYAYDLRSVKEKLSYLFADVEDPRDALELLVGDIMEDLRQTPPRIRSTDVHTFQDLINALSGGGQRYRGVHPSATVGKFLRYMRHFTQIGTTGLFVNTRDTGEENLAHHVWTIQPNQVYVIDTAQLKDFERAFVVGDVMKEVYRLSSGEITYGDVPEDIRRAVWGQDVECKLDEFIERPKKIVFFVDELNKYAPAGRARTFFRHHTIGGGAVC